MLFRSFESSDIEAIHHQMELSLRSFTTTLVFVFCDASQNFKAHLFQKQLRETFPTAGICLISGGNVSCN